MIQLKSSLTTPGNPCIFFFLEERLQTDLQFAVVYSFSEVYKDNVIRQSSTRIVRVPSIEVHICPLVVEIACEITNSVIRSIQVRSGLVYITIFNYPCSHILVYSGFPFDYSLAIFRFLVFQKGRWKRVMLSLRQAQVLAVIRIRGLETSLDSRTSSAQTSCRLYLLRFGATTHIHDINIFKIFVYSWNKVGEAVINMGCNVYTKIKMDRPVRLQSRSMEKARTGTHVIMRSVSTWAWAKSRLAYNRSMGCHDHLASRAKKYSLVFQLHSRRQRRLMTRRYV